MLLLKNIDFELIQLNYSVFHSVEDACRQKCLFFVPLSRHPPPRLMQVPVWDARFPARDAFGRFVSQSQRTQWPNVTFQEAQSVRFSPNEMGWFVYFSSILEARRSAVKKSSMSAFEWDDIRGDGESVAEVVGETVWGRGANCQFGG